MASEKEKLAAVLLNHWYTIARGYEIDRIKRRPKSQKYKQLSQIGEMSEEDIADIRKGFTSYTAKHFNQNIEFLVGTDEILKSSMKINFGRSTSRKGLPIEFKFNEHFTAFQSLLHALNFHDQTPLVKDIVENLPPLSADNSLDENGVQAKGGRFNLAVPSMSRQILSNFKLIESDILRSVDSIKLFINIFAMTSQVLSPENLEDIHNRRVYVKFIKPRVEDGVFKADEVSVEETEEAKSQRLLRHRLEEALRRRTQNASDITTDRQTVVYTFDNAEHSPLQVTLDVVTAW